VRTIDRLKSDPKQPVVAGERPCQGNELVLDTGQHSTVQITAQGDVNIELKIDQHSTADITSVNGNVNIGQKLDQRAISSITAMNGSITVEQGMSGSATATLSAPNGTITMDTIDGGCTLNWSAKQLNCPHQNGNVTQIP
jgi:DUF4097 and DUF4098 domain-containing protein YvlB